MTQIIPRLSQLEMQCRLDIYMNCCSKSNPEPSWTMRESQLYDHDFTTAEKIENRRDVLLSEKAQRSAAIDRMDSDKKIKLRNVIKAFTNIQHRMAR